MVSIEKIVWNKMVKGDDEAFSAIFQKCSGDLYVYGLKFTARQDIIEDCIQDLFIKLLKKDRKIINCDNVQFYLLKAFRNNLIRILKREKIYEPASDDHYNFQVVFSIEQSIIQEEEKNQQKQFLLEALKTLTSRQKEAIYLRYTKGLAYNQVAGVLDMEIESCRNLISRALNKLRKTMKEDIGIILYFLSTSVK